MGGKEAESASKKNLLRTFAQKEKIGSGWEERERFGVSFVLKMSDFRACVYANQNSAGVRGENSQSEMLR